MAAVWQASGTLLGSTGADISPVWPTHAIDDIGIVLASSRVVTETCLTPSTYTLLHGPIDVTTIWRTYVFYKRATSTTEANVLLDWNLGVGEKYGQVQTVRGAVTTDSPFAASNLFGDATDPIAGAGVTSTERQTIIVAGIGSDNASTSATVTGTNPASYSLNHFSTITTGADATGLFYSALISSASVGTGTVTIDHNSTMPAMGVLVAAMLDIQVIFPDVNFVNYEVQAKN